ncbi:hypothetical protein [Chloracidobacterium thermophilum]|uniref:hypothetical protein n=1 Tax=Chloracidobacterium thermophilum TaxID=458033 RepID=UPI001BB2E7BD|nr:hypothetical protein [Chloracidobacterium thermophilum]QUV78575.1 hypothetical protein J8C08_10880 [Chloracidobacterium thermophilum]
MVKCQSLVVAQSLVWYGRAAGAGTVFRPACLSGDAAAPEGAVSRTHWRNGCQRRFYGAFQRHLLGEYIPAQFGAAGPALAFVALAGCLLLGGWWWRQAARNQAPLPGVVSGVALAGWTMALITVPCFLQVYALRNHSAIHDFSALKFSLVIAVVPFVLLPVTLLPPLCPGGQPVRAGGWVWRLYC